MYCLLKNSFFLKLKTNFSKINLKNNYRLEIIRNNYMYKYNYNFFLNKNVLLFLFKYKNTNYFNIFRLNNFLFDNFFKSLSNLFKNNINFLFLDSDINQLLPLYCYIYGLREVTLEKNFFFVKKNHYTKGNYIYLYKAFIKKHNISCLIILDYNYFKKFFINILKTNVVVYSILPILNVNSYIDFYIYYSLNNLNVMKIVLYNSILHIFFYYYNIRISFFKIKYFKKINLLL